MRLRAAMDVDVPLFCKEPDENLEFMSELAERFGPKPTVKPEDIARVLTMMLGAPNGDGFQAIAIEEALFSHIERVKLVSAKKLSSPVRRRCSDV